MNTDDPTHWACQLSSWEFCCKTYWASVSFPNLNHNHVDISHLISGLVSLGPSGRRLSKELCKFRQFSRWVDSPKAERMLESTSTVIKAALSPWEVFLLKDMVLDAGR